MRPSVDKNTNNIKRMHAHVCYTARMLSMLTKYVKSFYTYIIQLYYTITQSDYQLTLETELNEIAC